MVFTASRDHITDSHQNQQDNRLTFVKVGCADLRMLRSDFGGMPSLGSAAFTVPAAGVDPCPRRPQIDHPRRLRIDQCLSSGGGGQSQISTTCGGN